MYVPGENGTATIKVNESGNIEANIGIDYSKEYLTITSLEDNNTISWYSHDTGNGMIKDIAYSFDKQTWYSTANANNTNSANGVSLMAGRSPGPCPTNTPRTVVMTTLNNGDCIYIRGDNSYYTPLNQMLGYCHNNFITSKTVNISGNIMSLLNSIYFEDEELPEVDIFGEGYIFYRLFTATKIVDASNLILPATTLTPYCYVNMFYGCTSLTTAPALPATTLAEGCYQNMFASCTNLNYIKMLATDVSVSGALGDWVVGVSATGTFVKSAGVTIPTGTSGIPEGWTVQTASA